MRYLRELRKKQIMPNGKPMNQQELAAILSVGRSTVAMWETDKSEPDNLTLQKIAKIFGTTVDALLEKGYGLVEEIGVEHINAYNEELKEPRNVAAHEAFEIVKQLPEDMRNIALEQLKALAKIANSK